jgi:Ca2+-binding EF-hand superfamily protein
MEATVPSLPYAQGDKRRGSTMASKEEKELVEKVRKLVQKRYGEPTLENMRKLFDAYDRDGDQKLGPDDLEALLKDADIGNGFTRAAWVKGVVAALDQNDDRKVSWDEFTAAIK